MGQNPESHPRIKLRRRLIGDPKNRAFTEFIFLSISHKLEMDERKEHVMNAIALAIFFLLRVAVPLGILLAMGEWARRRETTYRFRT